LPGRAAPQRVPPGESLFHVSPPDGHAIGPAGRQVRKAFRSIRTLIDAPGLSIPYRDIVSVSVPCGSLWSSTGYTFAPAASWAEQILGEPDSAKSGAQVQAGRVSAPQLHRCSVFETNRESREARCLFSSRATCLRKCPSARNRQDELVNEELCRSVKPFTSLPGRPAQGENT